MSIKNAFITENEELSSQTSYNTGSLLHFLSQDEDHQIIMINQFLEILNIKILTNYVDKLNKTKLVTRASSWVWNYMKKDNITTSTMNLSEHLNSVYRIFSYQQYKKNSDGQTIIDSDKSMQTILLMFSKIKAHKPAKQQKLLYHLTTWIVDNCQALSIVEENCFQQFCYKINPHFKFSDNFKLYQAVLTIEEFSYLHLGEHQKQFLSKIFEYWNICNKLIGETTDNNKLIVKGIRLFEAPYIWQKKLNNWLVKRDRYCQNLDNIQNEFNQLLENGICPISINSIPNVLEDTKWLLLEEPIHDVKTRWNLTFLILKRLLQLQDAVEQLARSLYWHPDFQQRKDEQSLSNKLLLETE
ncbi:1661_t:CDS:2 [Cetraspora pellucida]|uniref:1661_t:CDS:1 n=1 Tax=Cetraspora pellucida TaxID=1433469 RepID=A0A9N8VMR7_9GLOM|nr:1661_t:CDS:2 [Cetraspora pellucida]